MAPKKLENNFSVSTLGKLLVFLVNYAHYATILYYEKVRIFPLFLMGKIVLTYDQPELRPT
jgi:hypothetical protein